MFDFDAGKLIVIGIVALIVIGPKELPRVMRQVGQAAAKLRRMAAEFQGQFLDAIREADVESLKAEAKKLADHARIDVPSNPLAEIKAGITSALEATDKPATTPERSVQEIPSTIQETPSPIQTPAIAAPGDPESSLNSIALPRLPATPEGGETLAGEGIGPAVPDAGSGPKPPAATEAEMRALADALTAEMGAAAKPVEKTQDKV